MSRPENQVNRQYRPEYLSGCYQQCPALCPATWVLNKASVTSKAGQATHSRYGTGVEVEGKVDGGSQHSRYRRRPDLSSEPFSSSSGLPFH